MSRLHIRNLLFFICVAFLAYLPLTSFLFALKNDAYTGYFPIKFFMSESIHAGYFPAWNPYLNYGLPMHGDMSSGFWNPVTWLIAGIWGYNVYSYTIEEIFYLITGAIGMYQLTGYWQLQRFPRLIASIAYLCCGFNVGHLQHLNWISGAAFLPWCMDGYMRLVRQYSLNKLLSTTVSFYFLLASAHPGIVIGAAYLFLFIGIFHFVYPNEGESANDRVKRVTVRTLILIGTTTTLCFGIIYSVWEIIPHITRGQKISLEGSINQPSSIQTWISLLLPFGTTKQDNFFLTDLSLRNSYMSITMLVFFIYGIFSRKNAWQKFWLFVSAFFFLLSSTVFFKTAAYHFLPFTGYVRLAGEFRIFSILAMIVFAAISLHNYLSQEGTISRKLKIIFYTLAGLLIITLGYSLAKIVSTGNSIFFGLDSLDVKASLSSLLKQTIDKVSFYDTLLIQSLLQIFIFYSLFRVLRAGNNRLILAIVIADLVLATLLNMPYTGVGKLTNREVQAIIDRSPHGIPIPRMIATNSLKTADSTVEKIVGGWSMYSKEIGNLEKVAYPVNLKTTDNYFATTERQLINEKPFLFFTDSTDTSIQPIAFSPGELIAKVNTSSTNQLVYKQNFYPRWRYLNDGIDGKPTIYQNAFLEMPVAAGSHTIAFRYKATDIKILVFATLSIILLILSFLAYSAKKKKPSV